MAHFYVSESGAGLANGTNAANAYPMTWVNDPDNWGGGAGEIMPGDTIHFCGTITSVYTPQASGSAGNVVNHLWEPGAKFSKNYWPSAGAIQLNGGIGYLTFDGGNWILSTWNGIIECTDNGTNLGNQQSSKGIAGDNADSADCHHVTIKNLKVRGMYVKVFGDNDWTRYGYGIDISTAIGEITIENCYVSDGDGLIGISGKANSSPSGFYLINNVTRDGNHHYTIGPNDTNCSMSYLYAYGNDLDYWSTWDTTGDSPIHLDGFIFQNNVYDLTSRLDNVYIYRNHFGPNVGTRTTGAIFNSMSGASRQCANWYIFNNWFECGGSNAYGNYTWGGGYLSGIMGENVWAFNNTKGGTSVSDRTTGGAAATLGADQDGNCHYVNNLNTTPHGVSFLSFTDDDPFTNPVGGSATAAVLSGYFANIWSDYNVFAGGVNGSAAQWGVGIWYYNRPGFGGTPAWTTASFNEGLAAWQTWFDNNLSMPTPIWNTAHADPHSTTSLPAFDAGTYVPTAGDTVARGQGRNMSDVFAEMGLPATDYYGNLRPAVGAWTIGAFEGGFNNSLTCETLNVTNLNLTAA